MFLTAAIVFPLSADDAKSRMEGEAELHNDYSLNAKSAAGSPRSFLLPDGEYCKGVAD